MTMEATAHMSPQPGNGLPEAAARAGVDPCDVCCEALPAHACGDLTERDEHWLHEHTDDCAYCANELRRYNHLRDLLTVAGTIDEALTPPPLALPRRERVWYMTIASPVGDLLLAATAEGLREIEFASHVPAADYAGRLRERGIDAIRLERIDDADPTVRDILARTATELTEYFGGKRAQFDIPLDWGRMAPFQRAVLEATAAVPFGRVDTYAGIARRIGKPGATRAVGNALGRNPIPVIVPCHRVIRSDASLGGYTGGLGIKQHLLNLEGVTLG
jgi:methylated-DNA-[protein]-cysteine S-methyltransferase